MNGVTSVVAWLALFLSVIALVAHIRAQRQARRARERSVWDDEQLLRTAWLQEIEARGQTLLDQFAAAEQRLQERMIATATDVFPHTHGTAVTQRPEDGTTAEYSSLGAGREESISRAVEVPGGAVVAAVTAPDDSNLHAAAPPSVTNGSPSNSDAMNDPIDVTQRVHQLADAGHDVGAISRRLNMGGGEIELILSLRAPNDGK